MIVFFLYKFSSMLTIRPIIIMLTIEPIIVKLTSYLFHSDDFVKAN